MTAGDAADLALAAQAARRAGDVLMRWFGRALDVRYKSPDQPLTDADLAANDQIRELLARERPHDGWLSEESTDDPDRLKHERVWLVDPLDGTRSFIAGRAEFAVSIALVTSGEPHIGVVYNAASGELFRAVRGAGAALEVRGAVTSLRVSRSTAQSAVLIASRSEIAAGELDPFQPYWRIVPLGSTAYKMAHVAAGRAEAYLSRGPKSEWDVCAGTLLIEEAGGHVSDLGGRRLRFNRPDPELAGVLATNGAGHDNLRRIIASLPPSARMRRGDSL